MKKIRMLLLSTLTSLIILASNTSAIFADTSAYGAYGPHKPVPTGIEDIDLLVLTGILTYVGGIALITDAQLLKKKVLK